MKGCRRWLWAIAGLLCACGGAETPDKRPGLAAVAAENAAVPSGPRGPAGPASPSTPAGSYRYPHTVMVVCDDPNWCEEEVTDSLDIEARFDGAIEVKIELVQANAHMCSFEGTLGRSNEREWEWRAPDGEEECHLSLRWRSDAISVSSEGCRDFCGARAHLEGEFSYPPPKATGAGKSPVE